MGICVSKQPNKNCIIHHGETNIINQASSDRDGFRIRSKVRRKSSSNKQRRPQTREMAVQVGIPMEKANQTKLTNLNITELLAKQALNDQKAGSPSAKDQLYPQITKQSETISPSTIIEQFTQIYNKNQTNKIELAHSSHSSNGSAILMSKANRTSSRHKRNKKASSRCEIRTVRSTSFYSSRNPEMRDISENFLNWNEKRSKIFTPTEKNEFSNFGIYLSETINQKHLSKSRGKQSKKSIVDSKYSLNKSMVDRKKNSKTPNFTEVKKQMFSLETDTFTKLPSKNKQKVASQKIKDRKFDPNTSILSRCSRRDQRVESERFQIKVTNSQEQVLPTNKCILATSVSSLEETANNGSIIPEIGNSSQNDQKDTFSLFSKSERRIIPDANETLKELRQRHIARKTQRSRLTQSRVLSKHTVKSIRIGSSNNIISPLITPDKTIVNQKNFNLLKSTPKSRSSITGGLPLLPKRRVVQPLPTNESGLQSVINEESQFEDESRLSRRSRKSVFSKLSCIDLGQQYIEKRAKQRELNNSMLQNDPQKSKAMYQKMNSSHIIFKSSDIERIRKHRVVIKKPAKPSHQNDQTNSSPEEIPTRKFSLIDPNFESQSNVPRLNLKRFNKDSTETIKQENNGHRCSEEDKTSSQLDKIDHRGNGDSDSTVGKKLKPQEQKFITFNNCSVMANIKSQNLVNLVPIKENIGKINSTGNLTRSFNSSRKETKDCLVQRMVPIKKWKTDGMSDYDFNSSSSENEENSQSQGDLNLELDAIFGSKLEKDSETSNGCKFNEGIRYNSSESLSLQKAILES